MRSFDENSLPLRTASFGRTILLWGSFDRFLSIFFKPNKINEKVWFFSLRNCPKWFTANIKVIEGFWVSMSCKVCSKNFYRAHAKNFISLKKLYCWPHITPEDFQKKFYLVMRHFIIDAQKIPGGGEIFPPWPFKRKYRAVFPGVPPFFEK